MIRKRRITISPVGADASAVGTATLSLGRPGSLVGISVDYQNQPATTDLIVKADSTSGKALFTNTSSNTDIVGKPIVEPSVDEGNAAGAATDAGGLGCLFGSGLFFDVAQGDGQTSGDEKVVIDVWVLL